MSLLYQIVCDYIDDLIEKKREEIYNIENESIQSKDYKKQINELHRLINVLYVCKYKFKELFSFVQDIK